MLINIKAPKILTSKHKIYFKFIKQLKPLLIIPNKRKHSKIPVSFCTGNNKFLENCIVIRLLYNILTSLFVCKLCTTVISIPKQLKPSILNGSSKHLQRILLKVKKIFVKFRIIHEVCYWTQLNHFMILVRLLKKFRKMFIALFFQTTNTNFFRFFFLFVTFVC